MRPVTVLNIRVGITDLAIGRLLYPEKVDRPRTRGDCEWGIRPCPYVGCQYHLYLDMGRAGRSIKYNFPGAEPWDMQQSCALDIANASAHKGLKLELVGRVMNLTRQAVDLIQNKALAKANAQLALALDEDELADLRW